MNGFLSLFTLLWPFLAVMTAAYLAVTLSIIRKMMGGLSLKNDALE